MLSGVEYTLILEQYKAVKVTGTTSHIILYVKCCKYSTFFFLNKRVGTFFVLLTGKEIKDLNSCFMEGVCLCGFDIR